MNAHDEHQDPPHPAGDPDRRARARDELPGGEGRGDREDLGAEDRRGSHAQIGRGSELEAREVDLEVPTSVDAFGRPAERVVAEDEVAAVHWDERRWHR